MRYWNLQGKVYLSPRRTKCELWPTAQPISCWI
jgi:hypothetical protein